MVVPVCIRNFSPHRSKPNTDSNAPYGHLANILGCSSICNLLVPYRSTYTDSNVGCRITPKVHCVVCYPSASAKWLLCTAAESYIRFSGMGRCWPNAAVWSYLLLPVYLGRSYCLVIYIPLHLYCMSNPMSCRQFPVQVCHM
jgi:hypothetical protein